MGRVRCPVFNCFRATFYPNKDVELQSLPKPKEAEEVVDGLPYIDAEKEPDILIIRGIDPCLPLNGTNHNTFKYELMSKEQDPQLVVRRGQPFTLDITLSRPYNEDKDAVSFIFTVEDEEKPSYGQGTLVAVPLLNKIDRNQPWNVIIESTNENQMKVQVTSSPECIVSKWRMEIDTKLLEDGAYSYSWDTGIYIIFNPWNKNDQVYMKSDAWKEEAVMNDTGLIWRGTANRLRPTVWKYAQFEKDVLDCALYVVKEVGKVSVSSRADPVETVRAIAAAVNSADDNGIVMGDWSTEFKDGTHPTKWVGSMEILQKFYKKKKPVKYGQYWVFSGVLTTVCRTLGIPCRPVTNYSSAHDTQSSLTVDYFVNDKGKIMEELNSDSVWNFHVWDEVWMDRPDLGRGYGGWQAVDATPQVLSDGMFKVGPSSVTAVKHGEIKRPYDTDFLYAEVNADKVYWRYYGPTKPLKLVAKDIYGIGKLMSTKAPGIMDREDITSNYKYPEKSVEERSFMLKALRQSQNQFARYYLNEDFNDVYFNFELKDDIVIGKDFDVVLAIKNRNPAKAYRINVNIRVETVTYTGRSGDPVKKENFDITVKPQSTHEIKLNVTFDDYMKKLVDQGSFSVSCLAAVEEPKYEYYAQDDFRVRMPDIKIALQGVARAGQEVAAEIYLVNPLPLPLRKCQFLVEAPGLEKKLTLKVKKNIPPNERAIAQFTFKPQRAGRETIAAKFVSRELIDVDGFLEFEVQESKEENGNAV
ncbi:annulin [Agrilus planipennis]|uniref:protein-glutamine gamma-glutamyltransferase n=1 Tax=Agrilus planipennis TaxID=224129 RepID=A0A7F5R7H7_AGRPL|nr:annulin [Agrilus planipennis]